MRHSLFKTSTAKRADRRRVLQSATRPCFEHIESRTMFAVTTLLEADTLFRTVRLNARIGGNFEEVTGLSAGGLVVANTTLGTFTINGGSGGNVFTIQNTFPSTGATVINSGLGNDTVAIQATQSELF